MGRRFGSELGFALLNAMADGIEVFHYATYQSGGLLKYGLDDLKILNAERERRKVSHALYRLKKQHLIEASGVERRRAYRLTRLGEDMLKLSRQQPPMQLPDNLHTIVSFDIPEKESFARQAFRSYLRRVGFRRIHLSVWVSELDWATHLSKQLIDLKIGQWVIVMQGRILNDVP